MTLAIDGGYVGFCLGAYHDRLQKAEQWAKQGAVFCLDSSTSLRKQKYSWYKASRKVEPAIKSAMRQLSKQFEAEIRNSWPSQCLSEKGLEGDDIVQMVCEGYGKPVRVIAADHDMLCCRFAMLETLDGNSWGMARVQPKTLRPIKQGREFLAYQLLVGCTSDSVPRSLYTKDRTSLPWCFEENADPMERALSILTQGMARQMINVLMLPTPLMTGEDPIKAAERYQ